MRTKSNIPKPVVIVPTIYKEIAVRIGDDFEGNVNKYLDKGWKVKHINNTHNSSYKLFQILDIYDFPIFEVVAEKINASIKNLESH